MVHPLKPLTHNLFTVYYTNSPLFQDDDSYKPSDSSDDETIERESDAEIAQKLSMSMTESIPNSPASFCQR